MKFLPQIQSLRFNDESSLNIPRFASQQHEKIRSKIDPVQYERFVRNKFTKPATDIYAMYSPYSESYRAFFPFINFLRKTLKKGDVIVDLSNRTGWSAFLLAGLFPEQKIVSCWEGNTDVLGYNGFNFWINEAANIPNLEICFTKLREKLPFETDSVRVIFGFDLLHHHIRSPLSEEIFRIVTPDGFVFFPHVHLANSDPEPFFKRGGDLVHGLEYQEIFDQNSKGFSTAVYAEPQLFQFQKDIISEIQPNPETLHYNGLIALSAPENTFLEHLSAIQFLEVYGLENCNAIFNYLLEIDISGKISGTASPVLKEHMERHPVYQDVLETIVGYELNDLERKVIYWIKKGYTLQNIQVLLAIESGLYKSLLENLERLDIIQILPVHQTAIRLQIYHATQKWVEAEGHHTLPKIWCTALNLYAQNSFLKDDKADISYSYEDTDQIVKHIITSLQEQGVAHGNLILLEDCYSAVTFSIFWAAMHMGIICVPYPSSVSKSELDNLVAKYKPAMIFSEKEVAETTVPNVFFDETYEEENINHFHGWLADSPAEFIPTVQESDIAVILSTSGSNGNPKGVKLTHAQLFQSAANMVDTYHWTENDRFLAIGSLGSMSGLRNACIVPVKCGATVVVADSEDLHLPTRLADKIAEHNITIFSGAPVLYHQLLLVKSLKQRVKSLRLALSTGSKLTERLKNDFFEITGLRIKNYYGLTETSGICIAQKLTEDSDPEHCVGFPVDALIKIKGEANSGELFIYSGNLSHDYFEEEHTMDLDEEGWLRTKDLVTIGKNDSICLKGRSENFIKTQRSEIIYFSHLEEVIDQSMTGNYTLLPFIKNEAEYLALFLEAGQADSKQTEKQILEKINDKFGLWTVPLAFFHIDSIPRKQNGKVDTQKLLEII
jgi:acyl-coenzyme A synthetase/AMP-(fatty) acid ligase